MRKLVKRSQTEAHDTDPPNTTFVDSAFAGILDDIIYVIYVYTQSIEKFHTRLHLVRQREIRVYEHCHTSRAGTAFSTASFCSNRVVKCDA